MMPEPPAHVQHVPYSEHDKEIVAATLVFEAGGERVRGMQAVMNVIVNRTQGDSRRAREVCLTPFAFSSWNGKDVLSMMRRAKEHPCWNQALMLAEQGLKGKLPDITGGANHYYNHQQVHPPWAKKMQRTIVIGGNTFMKGN